MTTGMVIETVLTVAVIVTTTANVVLWAFRMSSHHRPSPRSRRMMGIFTVVWAFLLPVGGAVDLGLGIDTLAAGQQGAWQDIVTGGAALACWPVAILAL